MRLVLFLVLGVSDPFSTCKDCPYTQVGRGSEEDEGTDTVRSRGSCLSQFKVSHKLFPIPFPMVNS